MSDSKDNFFRTIVKSLNEIDYINIEDIPNIDLYMDQVTTFMDEHLAGCKRSDDDKILTKTMINNYTKNNLLPPPIRKKYTKEHLYLLIFIYYYKSFLSISDIQSIFNPLTDLFYNSESKMSLETIYTHIVDMENEQNSNLIKNIYHLYSKSKEIFPEEMEDPEEQDFLNRFALICMLGYDVYTKKTLIERLIDKTFSPEDIEKAATEAASSDSDQKTEH